MMRLRDGGEKRCLLLIRPLVLFLGKEIKERREALLFFLPMGNHDPATFLFKALTIINKLFWKFFQYLHSSTSAVS